MRRRRNGGGPGRQRGIALIAAILLVALGTIIAAAVAFESAMAARRGAAAYAYDQALLIAEGAEALAAYALREDLKNSSTYDYPGEPWSKPLGPIEVVPGVMLEAVVEDAQGRFNLNSLVKDDPTRPGFQIPDPESVAAFQQLLHLLQMEPKWADLVVDWIDSGIDPMLAGAEDSVYMGQNPPYRTANLPITSVSELLALPGFGRDNYVRLAPFVTALPRDVKLNTCSAPGVVLDAFLPGARNEFSDEALLQKNRAAGCFPKPDTEYKAAFDNPADYQKVSGKFQQTSSYFRLTSLVTIGTTEFNLYSLLYRDQNGARPIMRSYTPD
jgi:general secretion pathway protein K